MTREEAIAYEKHIIGFGFNDKASEFCEFVIKEMESKNAMFDRVLEIIKAYDLYKQDEDGDMVACKWELCAEIKALKGECG